MGNGQARSRLPTLSMVPRLRKRPRSRAGDDGDVEMTSSLPDADSIAEVVPTHSMSLVPEEQLNGNEWLCPALHPRYFVVSDLVRRCARWV